jgi:hypothetical protein
MAAVPAIPSRSLPVRPPIDEYRIRAAPLAALLILSGLCLLAPASLGERGALRRDDDDSAAAVTVAAEQGQVSWSDARTEGGVRRTP